MRLHQPVEVLGVRVRVRLREQHQRRVGGAQRARPRPRQRRDVRGLDHLHAREAVHARVAVLEPGARTAPRARSPACRRAAARAGSRGSSPPSRRSPWGAAPRPRDAFVIAATVAGGVGELVTGCAHRGRMGRGQRRLERVPAVLEGAHRRLLATDAAGERSPLGVVGRVEGAAAPDLADVRSRPAAGSTSAPAQPGARRAREIRHAHQLDPVRAVAVEQHRAAVAVQRQLVARDRVVRGLQAGQRAAAHARGHGHRLVVAPPGAAEGEDLLDLVAEEEAPEVEVMDRLVDQGATAVLAAHAPGRKVAASRSARRRTRSRSSRPIRSRRSAAARAPRGPPDASAG